MKVKKFCRRATNLFGLVLAMILFLSPQFAEAAYTIGIVGIDSRVKDGDINLGDYTDLTQLENPVVYAQNIFSEILTTDLPKIGLDTVDKTAQADSARINEIIFQLNLGNPAEAVKLFDEKLDYLIYGYITNLTVTHKESIVSSNLAVRIDLTVRIVDAATGKVVCVATGKGEGSSRGGGYRKSFSLGGKEVSEECWHGALDKAITQVVDKIKKQV